MFKSKSLHLPSSPSDGTRICVSRWLKKCLWERFHKWIKELAPSIELLSDYRYHNLDWKDYEARYRKEMNTPEVLKILKELKKRSDGGETITLLCYETDDSFCHRRLLIDILEKL